MPPNTSTQSTLSPAEIRAAVARRQEQDPPPPLADGAVVKLRALFHA